MKIWECGFAGAKGKFFLIFSIRNNYKFGVLGEELGKREKLGRWRKVGVIFGVKVFRKSIFDDGIDEWVLRKDMKNN